MCRYRRPFPRQKGGRPPSVTARALGVKGTQCYLGWYLRSLHTPPCVTREVAQPHAGNVSPSRFQQPGQVPRLPGRMGSFAHPSLSIAIRADHTSPRMYPSHGLQRHTLLFDNGSW